MDRSGSRRQRAGVTLTLQVAVLPDPPVGIDRPIESGRRAHGDLVCTVSDNGSTVVWVQLAGALGLATSWKAEQALRRAELLGARLLLLDLRKLAWADSGGVRVIVAASRRARGEGRKLIVTGASRQVETLLALSGPAEGSIPAIALPPFWALFEPHAHSPQTRRINANRS
jgi:anti-sigma B factor antagonist